MQRETKEIITPGGVKVIIKTWISAREANIVKQPMLQAMKVDVGTGSTSSTINGDFMIEQEKNLLKVLVVSVNGDDKDPVDNLLDNYPNADYQAVIAEVNKIYSANLTQTK